MNIIINALLLTGPYSGIQHSIESFLLALATLDTGKTSVIVPNEYSGSLLDSKYNIIKPKNKFKNRVERILWENAILPKYFNDKNFIYHTPGQILPIVCPVKSIVTIHDTVPTKYPSLSQKVSVAYYKYLLPYTIKRANKIIAVSNKVKRDILNQYNVDENKISVLYHGIRPQFRKIECKTKLREVSSIYGLPDDYILFVGNIEPRKNLKLLFRSFKRLKENIDFKHKLVIVGKKGWKYNDILIEIKRLKITSEVHFLGYVNDSDLPTIYSRASIFVMPSIYEGFGLPVLEAMACGVPVIISNGGALPEIARGNALCIESNSEKELVDGINRMLHNKSIRDRYIEKGITHSKRFDWGQVAKKHLEIYLNVLNN